MKKYGQRKFGCAIMKPSRTVNIKIKGLSQMPFTQPAALKSFYFNKVSMRASQIERTQLVNFHDKFIFVVGGSIYDSQSSIKTIRTTLVYYIEKDKWYEGPDLNEARHGHSCCTLGNMVYAFAGEATSKNKYG